MAYPEHLLPQATFHSIAWQTSLCDYFLLRSTPEKDILDPDTQLVRDKFITTGSREQLTDYSTNLYGVYRSPDAALEWVQGERKLYFTSPWHEGDQVEMPADEDFIQREDFGFFFYSVRVIHNFPQPIQIPRMHTHTKARCYVCHTPVNGNFWHFSVRWKVGNEDIETALSKNERRNLLSLVKTFLKNHAILFTSSIPDTPVPTAWYRET